ncbi:unnamed protein product [Effrenium voratum]|nr:unnamed protein product [Effrenium voratum]|mmetsp:Transcript_69938/g.166986  ORF Transcript_69938/g.166986 Transcript_69938/m.166986 type:complete len:280 (-) Transcript_69938:273-1112(-)
MLKSPGVSNWSPNLENEVPDRPELTRILSSSRTGRMHWHRNQFVPLPCRPPPAKLPEEFIPPEHRQHLIYLALYRDKVDQHQAARSQSPHSQSAQSMPEEESMAGFSPGSAERRPHTATAHTAAVNAMASGLDEHLEAKRLGKLFDEWVATQDIDTAYEKIGLPSPKEGKMRQTMELPAAAIALGVRARRTPRAGSHKSSRGRPEVQEVADAATTHTRRFADRRKLERLWNVMTNPKVRCASLSDKVGYERDRQMPARIEGIKPLMLYKLYTGPWRLDV